MTNTLAFRNI